jgi:iron complex transport system substrate-binding protein
VVRSRSLAVSLLAVLVLLPACGGAEQAPPHAATTPKASANAFPLTLVDDDGVSVTLQAPPQRIVTWAPSNTEILFALGLGGREVGDSGPFDNYPPEAASIPHVGGEGGVTPDIEKIVSLRADLVLNGFEGGQEWKDQLRKLAIPVFSIYASTLDDAIHDIRTVGRITGAAARADAVVRTMSAKIESVAAVVAKTVKVACFFEAYYPPLTTVGPHTFIYDILRRAGCDPVSARAKGDYPQWSVDKLVQEGPDVYFAASESAESPTAVASRPGFGGITAVKDGHVFLIDSDLVTRPGPRVVQALEAIARDLHPSAF